MITSKEKINSNIKKEIQKLNIKLEALIGISKKYSLIRLSVFISIVFFFIGLYVFNYKTSATIIGALLGIIFLVLMHNHSKIEKSIKRFRIYIQIKKEELARSELDWMNIPLLDIGIANNPTFIEQDLNIIEKHGLLNLISTCVSHESVKVLRDWLGGKNIDKKKIVARQKIVGELKQLRRFRNKLLLKTKLSINSKISKNDLSEWLKSESEKKWLGTYTIFLTILVAVNITLFACWLFNVTDSYYYQFLLIYIFFYFAGYKYVKDIQFVSEFLYDEVRKYSSIFNFIEKYNYGSSESLKHFLEPFLKPEYSPTKSINKIFLTIEILNLRSNPFVWIFLICFAPLDYLLSIRVDKFRLAIKKDFPIWLKTWHDLEAYSSLAEFAYLNPDYHFPVINKSSKLLEAKKLGHPLIKHDSKMSNDFDISESSMTNIITGSNMSGKSTFLRTVGVNILLAYAGSVVDAEKLVLSKVNLFTCIKVSDSVVDGISYFYAEVKRLREIIEDVYNSEGDSLVLIDEIYKGTNNIERIIGSKALIKYFSNENIYNMVSTHDLELVKIADELTNVKNFHFKEMVEENKMTFDFKLMDGPCPTTNALKIMKLEGLPT